jgi:hypothetical protein
MHDRLVNEVAMVERHARFIGCALARRTRSAAPWGGAKKVPKGLKERRCMIAWSMRWRWWSATHGSSAAHWHGGHVPPLLGEPTRMLDDILKEIAEEDF